jgi:hypothetical protein
MEGGYGGRGGEDGGSGAGYRRTPTPQDLSDLEVRMGREGGERIGRDGGGIWRGGDREGGAGKMVHLVPGIARTPNPHDLSDLEVSRGAEGRKTSRIWNGKNDSCFRITIVSNKAL